MSETTVQTALVTGATRGIGRAIALTLAQRGYRVIGTATSEEHIKRLFRLVPNILFCATYSRLLTHDSLRTRPDQCLAQSHLAAFQECTP